MTTQDHYIDTPAHRDATSPLPWTHKDGRIYSEYDLSDLGRKETVLVADTSPDNSALTEYDEANAALICRAVNSHQALVDALNRTCNIIASRCSEQDIEAMLMLNAARQALAQAKASI